MLSKGTLKQEAIIDIVGSKPEALALLLGPEWKGGFVKGDRDKSCVAIKKTIIKTWREQTC